MELKRYVLFRGEILEVIKPSVLEIGNTITFQAEGVYDFRFQLDKKDVKKTSNNILDFVEVGDIIKIVKNDNEVKLVYIEKVNGVEDYLEVNGKFKKQLRINDNTLITDNTLNHVKEVILLKLQPNGDYKKYEVK